MARRLTWKQKQFVKEYVNHKGNGTQAALQVYETTPETARNIAWENLTKPHIQEAIEETARKLGITQSTILDEFKDLGTRQVDNVSADAKLRSLIEMAKMLRMYPASKHTTLNVSFKGKLKEMKYQDLKNYVEGMRSKNDELIKEVEELDTPQSESNVG